MNTQITSFVRKLARGAFRGANLVFAFGFFGTMSGFLYAFMA
ncbi:MAG: hypothetical protein WCT28_02830 [Patescibacteria group bacterium]|jgi:hypothetical protein